ncbi:MAG: sigma-54 interaction domain-containing protein, partial [Bacillota bacterium]
LPTVNKTILSDIIPIKLKSCRNAFLYIFRDITALSVLMKQFSKLQKYNEQLASEIDVIDELPSSFQNILTRSRRFISVLRVVSEVARTDVPLILCGESGTGKELIVRAIHAHSDRKQGKFIALNCAAFPENLVEAELFGYVGGAFTGARREGQTGKFELAHKGTLFLDEITEMPLGVQAKMLRAVEHGEIAKIGEKDCKHVDVRIVAATNRDIRAQVRQNQFRADLYFRLNVIKIDIPPMRERKEDILFLAEHFLNYYQKQYKKDLVLAEEVKNIFMDYQWPGNVRELLNIIQNLVILAKRPVITEDDLPFYMRINNIQNEVSDFKNLKNEDEKIEIINTLKECKYNKSQAMKRLGISRQTFYKRLKQYEINV